MKTDWNCRLQRLALAWVSVKRVSFSFRGGMPSWSRLEFFKKGKEFFSVTGFVIFRKPQEVIETAIVCCFGFLFDFFGVGPGTDHEFFDLLSSCTGYIGYPFS